MCGPRSPISTCPWSTLPASQWYLNPILYTIVSAGVAIAVFIVLTRRHRRSATFDRIDMVSPEYAEAVVRLATVRASIERVE